MLNFVLASCCSSDRFFCSPVFCPSNSTKPTSPETPFLSLPLGHHCSLLKLPCLHHNLEGTSGETAETAAEAACLPLSSQTQSCALLVQCLKTVVSRTSPSFLAMDSGRAIPVTPSWLQAEMSPSVWKIQSLWGDPQTAVVNLHVYKAFLVSKLFCLVNFHIHLLATFHQHLGSHVHSNSLSFILFLTRFSEFCV